MVAGYLGLALLLTWPAVTGFGALVPGAARTDLWNSLWTFWFAAEALGAGELPWTARLLNHPEGGTLMVSDPLGVLLMTPLQWVVSLPAAYTLLVWWRLALAGIGAHLAAEALLEDAPVAPSAHWVAGVGFAAAPVVLSGVHNGTSEAFNVGWAALAVFAMLRLIRGGGWGWSVATGALLAVSAVASWYAGVVSFAFCGVLAVVGQAPWRIGVARRAVALALGLALAAPAAKAFHDGATAETNLVGIKHAQELQGVRRTTGPADPVGYVRGGDFRSPDFRVLSRYGENFIHCTYLGWVLILGAAAALAGRPRRVPVVVLAGGVTLGLLSLGPVLVSGGSPVILLGDRAVPLPYFLVERLPGFSSLSLLYRLAVGPALAAALLAAAGYGRLAARGGAWRWLPALVVLAVLAEKRVVSPLTTLPDAVDATPAPALEALADAPPGAVLNFPVVGGRPYLYEQSTHGKPLAGTLNFPNNRAGQRVWKAMLRHVDEPPEDFARRTASAARARGIRYLVVHVDAMARPDQHDAAVKAVKAAFAPLPVPGVDDASRLPVRVYALW